MSVDLRNKCISRGDLKSQTLLILFSTFICENFPSTVETDETCREASVLAEKLDSGDDNALLVERASGLIADLAVFLDAHSPEGYFFGSHPDYPDEYGYWHVSVMWAGDAA
jgi:hypothetical protein